MRQAITTKYIGPTDHRGSRVKATAQAGSIVVGWDDALDSDDNHTAAARALARKYGWSGLLVGGGAPDGRGNCYVLLDLHALRTMLVGPTSGDNARRLAEGIIRNAPDLDGKL